MNEEIKVIISAEITKLKQELDKGKKELKDLEAQGKSSGGGLGKALQSTGKVAAVAFAAVAAGVAAVGGALIAAVESTREFRTQQAMLASAFQTVGGSAEVAKETFNDLHRVLGDTGQATEAAQQLSQLTTEQQALGEWTTICQGVYATFGESLPIESLAEASNETAKTGELTGALADALNWAGVNEEEFADKLFLCNSEAEREALIRETLTGLYSEAAANYEETGKAILDANEAQLKLTESTAEIGAAIEPIMTVVKNFGATVLSDLSPAITTVAEGFQDMLNGVDGGKEKMLGGIRDIMGTVSELIETLLPDILEIGTDIVISLATGIVNGLPQIISALAAELPTLIQGILTGLFTLVTTILANIDDIIKPILAAVPGLVTGIITALVTALPLVIEGLLTLVVDLVKALPEIITPLLTALPGLVTMLIDGILSALPVLITGLIDVVISIVEALPQILTALIDAVPQIIESILTNVMDALPLILDGAIKLVLAVVDALPDIILAVVKAVPELIKSILAAVLGCLPQIIAGLVLLVARLVVAIPEILVTLITAVVDLVVGLFETIVSIFVNLPSYFSDIFEAVWDGVVDAFSDVGAFFKGIWGKITNGFTGAGDWFKNTFGNCFKNTKEAFANSKEVFAKIWSGIKSAFGNVSDWFKNTFSSAWTKVKEVFSSGGKIFDGIKDGILNSLKTVINGIINGINKVISVPFNGINSALQRIKGISIAGISPFSWMPTISVPKIPQLYRGGVLEKGQVGLLEGSGAEAVVPLENNDAWLTKIAEKLHGFMDDGSGRDIILQVDGKTLARTSIKSINQLTKQTGKLDLILA